jgi:hypothetical protein
MKNKLPLYLLILITSLSGCATQRVFLGGESNKDPDFQKSQAFWFGGEFQSRDIDAELICKDMGVQKIETVQSFGDTILGTLSFGLYTPRTLKIYCNKNAEYHIEKHFGETLRTDITTMKESLVETMSMMQKEIEDLQGQMNNMQSNVESDIDKLNKRIKKEPTQRQTKCSCNYRGDAKKCANIQIIDGKSCVNNIPEDSEIQLIDQVPTKVQTPEQELETPLIPVPNFGN